MTWLAPFANDGASFTGVIDAGPGGRCGGVRAVARTERRRCPGRFGRVPGIYLADWVHVVPAHVALESSVTVPFVGAVSTAKLKPVYGPSKSIAVSVNITGVG